MGFDREASAPGAWSAARFQVEFAGIPPMGFVRCRGLQGATSYISVREGGRDAPLLFPGETRWEPLIIERLLQPEPSLWGWFARGDARDGRIVLLAPNGEPVGAWRLRAGRPSRWWGVDLDAGGRAVAVETLEIVHEGVEWEATWPQERSTT